MSDSDRSFASMSAYAGEGAWVTCYGYPEKPPILSMHLSGATLTISFAERDGQVNAQAVEFARELVRAVEEFAAEAERLYAAGTAKDAAA